MMVWTLVAVFGDLRPLFQFGGAACEAPAVLQRAKKGIRMIKAAIVGLGRWGQILVDSVQGKSEVIQFVRGVSRDPARTREFGEKSGLNLTNSYQDVITDPGVDAVVLATPHSQHFGEIIAAVKAGKHVFVEKPMTLTGKDAGEAVRACEQAGVALGIGFGRRLAPAFIEMQQAIADGRIGDILHVEANFSGPSGYQLVEGNWRATKAEAPSGGMTARGLHTLDGMIALNGPVQSVFAYSDRHKLEVEIEDTTSMLLRFANGTTGYLATIFATPNYWRIHAFGSAGWAEMRGERSLSISDLKGNVETKNYDATSLECAILENFAKAAQSKGTFVVTGAQAINGIATLEAIGKSVNSGKPVSVG
jgi:predicted dehydrogenase